MHFLIFLLTRLSMMSDGMERRKLN
jgi:hypothetical protein